MFGDQSGRTDLTCHDMGLGHAIPINQQPYRLGPHKLKLVRKEIKYMLDHRIIESSQSEWSSPVILISRPHGSQSLCIDFRKVNAITKTHTQYQKLMIVSTKLAKLSM